MNLRILSSINLFHRNLHKILQKKRNTGCETHGNATYKRYSKAIELPSCLSMADDNTSMKNAIMLNQSMTDLHPEYSEVFIQHVK